MVDVSLNQELKQDLKQHQYLMMTPQMQQSIHILQMPVLELSAAIEAEMEQNPILEYSENEEENNGEVTAEQDKELEFENNDLEIIKQLDDEFQDYFASSGDSYSTTRSNDEEKQKAFLESSLQASPSFFESLVMQAHQTFDSEEELHCAEVIIGNLDESGFLQTPIEEISVLEKIDISKLKDVLSEIQSFEPFGIGASSIQESFLIQLKCLGHENTLAYAIVRDFYDDLLHNRIPIIKRKLKKNVNDAIKIISKLNLHPGVKYSNEITHYATPDVIIRDGEIDINDDWPSVKINKKYIKMLKMDSLDDEIKEYIHQKIASGKWLMHNIFQRNETLLKITKAILKKQKQFFEDSNGKIVPCSMNDIADEVGMHISTVWRTLNEKYLHCSRGLFPLRFFVTNSFAGENNQEISAQSIKDLIKEIIAKEDKSKPLSDMKISLLIKRRGISCARRTIAKYRQQLRIGSVSQRRRFL